MWRGGTGVLMAHRCRHDLAFDADVFLADTFAGRREGRRATTPGTAGGEHADTSPDIVRGLARQIGVDVHLLVGDLPR